MLSIDESSDTASFLCLCDGMNGQSSLTRRFWTIDFYDSSLRITTYAKRIVECDTAGRNHLYILDLFITQFHDRAFAEVLFDLRHGSLKGLQFTFIRI